jgi:hypothetical protein
MPDEIDRNLINDFLNLPVQPAEKIPTPSMGGTIKTTMEGVEKMPENKEGIDGVVGVVKFAVSTAKAIKNSLADDGKITIADSLNFADPIMKLPAAISGISKIPAELKDTITDDEKAQIIEVIKDSGVLPDKAEAIAEKAIAITLDIKAFVFDNFING